MMEDDMVDLEQFREMAEALRDQFEAEAKSISKGNGSAWSLMQVREWRDEADRLLSIIDSAGKSCPCGEPTCTESWEPGCGLGSSKDHAAVSEVTRQLIERDRRGRAKYGTSLDRTDLSISDWLQHMAEELLDAAGYALAAKREAQQPAAVVGLVEKWRSELHAHDGAYAFTKYEHGRIDEKRRSIEQLTAALSSVQRVESP